MKLTSAQRQALKAFLKKGEDRACWWSARDVWTSGNAANALTSRKLLERKSDNYNITYRLTDEGRGLATQLLASQGRGPRPRLVVPRAERGRRK